MTDTSVIRYKLAFAVAKYIEFGGMQRTMLRMARECMHRGHEVHVFAANWLGEAPSDIPTHILPVNALTNHGINRSFSLKMQVAVVGKAFDCITGFTKIEGLDVYYVGETCYAARAERHGRLYRLLPRYRCLKALEEAVFGAASNSEILLIAPEEGEKCKQYYNTEPKRLHLLPPGINRDRLVQDIPTTRDCTDLRAKLGVANKGFLLLNVVSRFRTKGVDRAIRAVAALPVGIRRRTTLAVVGGDNPRPFQKLAAALGVGDAVIFTGAREDVAKFYYAADLLLHPSYTESAGATILEAMICGLPVLVTANCGFAFHVERAQAGLICPQPCEQETLNAMLAHMLTSNTLVDWGQNGVSYSKSTDLYSLIERAADIIIARAQLNRASQ
ncbi:MAG: glycosyltransferase family 4 protein [Acidiferrobacterales bacterium]|nr:glycosyltransferase family 4 protein [Acidiferrobacterales bacterium]